MVMADAIGICIVGFAISVSMGQLFAKSHNYDLDSNQVCQFIVIGVIYRTGFDLIVSMRDYTNNCLYQSQNDYPISRQYAINIFLSICYEIIT